MYFYWCWGSCFGLACWVGVDVQGDAVVFLCALFWCGSCSCESCEGDREEGLGVHFDSLVLV